MPTPSESAILGGASLRSLIASYCMCCFAGSCRILHGLVITCCSCRSAGLFVWRIHYAAEQYCVRLLLSLPISVCLCLCFSVYLSVSVSLCFSSYLAKVRVNHSFLLYSYLVKTSVRITKNVNGGRVRERSERKKNFPAPPGGARKSYKLIVWL